MQRAARHTETCLERSGAPGIVDFISDEIESPVWPNKSIVAHAYLLGGEWDAVRERVAGDNVLGWSSISNAQALDYLDWCLDLARRRIDGIVSNKHRRSYDKAADLAVACAEVLRLRGNEPQAGALLGEIRARYPRHSAFQREIRAATGRPHSRSP